MCVLWFNISLSQESINAAGGEALGNGGMVSFTVGQIDYIYLNGSNGSVSQGVQHAYEIFSLSTNETTLQISLKVFPNPTTENLTIEINNLINEKLSYQLFDLQGRLLEESEITIHQTSINTSVLPASTYFIHILNHQKINVQSFKIVKQ